MFSRTGKMFRAMLDMPLENQDDLVVEGCLRYWGDTAEDALQFEDDDFYGSLFTEMLIINAVLRQKKMGDMEVMTCSPRWDSGLHLNSSMSDKELGLENILDDGETLAEG